MNPTPEQQLAIDIRNTNVLVSAAAGSGKTSVLVNRVVQRVTGEKDGVDIDRLLIMTFTNAAAAEMAGRIRDSIEDLANKIRQDKDHDREALKRIEKQAILTGGDDEDFYMLIAYSGLEAEGTEESGDVLLNILDSLEMK